MSRFWKQCRSTQKIKLFGGKYSYDVMKWLAAVVKDKTVVLKLENRLTFTRHSVLTELVPIGTATLEPSRGVHALSTAVVGALGTLINICDRRPQQLETTPTLTGMHTTYSCLHTRVTSNHSSKWIWAKSATFNKRNESNTFTRHPIFTELVAWATPTLEPSRGVRTHSAAVVGALRALINICKWMCIVSIQKCHSKLILALQY